MHKIFQLDSIHFKTINKDKDKGQDSATTSEGDLTNPKDAHHTNTDPSHEREAREAARDAAPSQARSGGHGKGDAKGSCTVPSHDE